MHMISFVNTSSKVELESVCSFTFYDHERMYHSKVIWNTVNPHFQFQEQFSIASVTEDFLEYLLTHALVLELWGVQRKSLGSLKMCAHKPLNLTSYCNIYVN